MHLFIRAHNFLKHSEMLLFSTLEKKIIFSFSLGPEADGIYLISLGTSKSSQKWPNS